MLVEWHVGNAPLSCHEPSVSLRKVMQLVNGLTLWQGLVN